MNKEEFLKLSDLDKVKYSIEESLKEHKGYKSEYWKGSAFMGESILQTIEQVKELTLTDVGKCNCDGNDDVFEEQYVLQHLINNTWQVVGEKTNTVWKQGEKEDCIKWMDL